MKRTPSDACDCRGTCGRKRTISIHNLAEWQNSYRSGASTSTLCESSVVVAPMRLPVKHFGQPQPPKQRCVPALAPPPPCLKRRCTDDRRFRFSRKTSGVTNVWEHNLNTYYGLPLDGSADVKATPGYCLDRVKPLYETQSCCETNSEPSPRPSISAGPQSGERRTPPVPEPSSSPAPCWESATSITPRREHSQENTPPPTNHSMSPILDPYSLPKCKLENVIYESSMLPIITNQEPFKHIGRQRKKRLESFDRSCPDIPDPYKPARRPPAIYQAMHGMARRAAVILDDGRCGERAHVRRPKCRPLEI